MVSYKLILIDLVLHDVIHDIIYDIIHEIIWMYCCIKIFVLTINTKLYITCWRCLNPPKMRSNRGIQSATISLFSRVSICRKTNVFQRFKKCTGTRCFNISKTQWHKVIEPAKNAIKQGVLICPKCLYCFVFKSAKM